MRSTFPSARIATLDWLELPGAAVVTVTFTAPMTLPPKPSAIVTVKLSAPRNPSAGA